MVVKRVLLNVPLTPPLGGLRLVIDQVPPLVVEDVPVTDAPANGMGVGDPEVQTKSGPPASIIRVELTCSQMMSLEFEQPKAFVTVNLK